MSSLRITTPVRKYRGEAAPLDISHYRNAERPLDRAYDTLLRLIDIQTKVHTARDTILEAVKLAGLPTVDEGALKDFHDLLDEHLADLLDAPLRRVEQAIDVIEGEE
tara:strand:+ start:762 stop:1082 length:321 start_codon:yes stop_codon:yes gene_type:complete